MQKHYEFDGSITDILSNSITDSESCKFKARIKRNSFVAGNIKDAEINVWLK